MDDKKLKLEAARNGIIAILIIILINFGVLYYLNFPAMAVYQLKKYFPLLLILIPGFGFQVGLFTYLRGRSALGCSTTIASGGISSGSMILCCSHYLVSILPFLGVSALSSIANYNFQILVIGVISNFAGIAIMLWKSKKSKKRG